VFRRGEIAGEGAALKEFAMSHLRLIPLDHRTLGRLLLALALLAGSLAWLSPAAQAAPQEKPGAAVQMYAVVDGSRLYVDAVGLPRLHYFSLRVRLSSADPWTKLKNVSSDRAGELVTSASLPSAFKRADRVQVCLKDKETDKKYCTEARRLY
jgi:hypothetical protein